MGKNSIYEIGRKTDITGYRFGRLVILREDVGNTKSGRHWMCQCDCGRTSVASTENLNRGHTRSCGCLWSETLTTHGKSTTPEYVAWANMIQRCNNPANPNFKYYGDRGVTVCAPWVDSFDNFYADMGERPGTDHSIERRDVNGNYEPDNCYWATPLVQANNKRSNVRQELGNVSLTIAQLSNQSEVDYQTIRERLKRGIPVEEAIQSARLNGHYFTYQGKQMTIVELSEISGHPASTLYYRLVTAGWSVEAAINTPGRKKK